MIVLKPIGGLGNQMFQAAYAYYVAQVFEQQKFEIDLVAYETYKTREFSLNNLVISRDFEISSKTNKKLQITSEFYRCYQKIIKVLTRQTIMGNFNFYLFKKNNMLYNSDQYFYEFSKEEINKDNNIYIYGYFQSIQYFSELEEVIKEKMRILKEETEEEIEMLKNIKQKQNSVAISIRIGDDYTKSSTLNVCDKNYFKRAIERIEQERENSCYFIFSDDIEKVKIEMMDILEGKDIIFIEGFNDYQSLRLMYNCKDFIISNSSFSWWGAYLGINANKIILAPSKWYNGFKKQPDIYYESMSLIDV